MASSDTNQMFRSTEDSFETIFKLVEKVKQIIANSSATEATKTCVKQKMEDTLQGTTQVQKYMNEMRHNWIKEQGRSAGLLCAVRIPK